MPPTAHPLPEFMVTLKIERPDGTSTFNWFHFYERNEEAVRAKLCAEIILLKKQGKEPDDPDKRTLHP